MRNIVYKYRFAKKMINYWLCLLSLNLLSFLFFSTSIGIKAVSANDSITENNQGLLNKKIDPSDEESIKVNHTTEFINSLRETGQKRVNQPLPIQSQTITQQVDAEKLGRDLLIEPVLPTIPRPEQVPKKQTSQQKSSRTYTPGLSFGAPSAFGASWGDIFVGAGAATPGKSRDGNPDGSMTAGFGLGDPYNLIGLELAFNNGSVKNFGYNGTFDLKAHRIVYRKTNHAIGVAAGWRTFAQYGTEGIRPSGVYGVVTSYSFLQPDNPVNPMALSFSLGAGGGDFRQGKDTTGLFAGFGVQVHPQIGMGIGWSGVGLNAGISVVPLANIPFAITAQGADLTDNSVGGRILVLTVGYGFNFVGK